MKRQLFIIGVSRSGSKLVRDILNTSDYFRISRTELKIIPSIVGVGRRSKSTDTLLSYEVDKIFDIIIKSTFIKKLEWEGANSLLSRNEFRDKYTGQTHQDIFEYLVTLGFQMDLDVKPNDSVRFFGDKTPSNYRYASRLNSAYNSAVFLHVVRDGRSVALSFSKSWGKTLVGSALKWSREMKKIRESISSVEHLNISYEKIIDDTQSELNKLTSFLDMPLESIDLESFLSTEQFGSAAGSTGISKNRLYSYERLPRYLLRIIESIQYDELVRLGYNVELHRYHKTVKAVFSFFYPAYRLLDFFLYCWHLVFKEYGFSRGVVFIAKTIRLKLLESHG